MKKVLFAVIALALFVGGNCVAQSNTTQEQNATNSKMQTKDKQEVVVEQSKTMAAYQQKEQEIHVQIKAKKVELENSTDSARKAILNDEIQQLQDDLIILKNPPVEMTPVILIPVE